jgi:predicted small lipoprotein YifL
VRLRYLLVQLCPDFYRIGQLVMIIERLKTIKLKTGLCIALYSMIMLLTTACGAKGSLYLPEEESAKQQQSEQKEQQKKKKADSNIGAETETETDSDTESKTESTIDSTTDNTTESTSN